ncbi:MAG: VanW family protein [Lachnospiraceae bacterium]|nr:VanW family protein [Candidatus Minthocola equi]
MKKKQLLTITTTLLLTAFMMPAISYATIPGLNIGQDVTQTTTEPQQQAPQPVDFSLPDGVVIDDSMVIAEGIYCGNISLGGMHPSAAKATLDGYFESVKNSSLIVTAGTLQFATSFNQLGFEFDASNAVNQATFLGKYGLLIDRYKQLADLKKDKVLINVPYTIDENALNAFVTNDIAAKDSPAKDASITRSNGDFVITPSVTGLVTDVQQTIEAIKANLATNLQPNLQVEAIAVVTEPRIKTADLECIHDQLGSFSTDYSGSNDNRKNNLKVGSGNLNGMVIMPGESFSVSENMKERTPENGYMLATEYLSGESVEAYGGGVCQVASTVYNAALRAELQIDKRSQHSMLVSYVEPSFDAAISWGFKDLVFTNNTGNPIYIATSANGETLKVTFYGKEYRPSTHKVTYENVIVKRIESTSQIIEDPTQPLGVIVSTKGSNHDECVSYLVKKVYENGNLVETIKFAQDEYQASHEIITMGSGEPLPTEPSMDPFMPWMQ